MSDHSIAVEREPSPEKFLRLFRQVSGMRTLEELRGLEEKQERSISSRRNLIDGAIIVGSSTDPNATPKDLDVVFVVRGINASTRDYAEELRYNFDLGYFLPKIKELTFPLTIQHGRLDFLGYIPPEETSCDPLFIALLQRAPDPIVYAFDVLSALQIQSMVDNIRKQGKV